MFPDLPFPVAFAPPGKSEPVVLPKEKVRTAPHPVRDREEFLALKKALNGVRSSEASYNNNGGGVIAFGFEREGNARIKGFRAKEIEEENRRKEAEERRIQWTE